MAFSLNIRRRQAEQAEINEFQPDALAIKNAPLPWWAGSGMVWLVCFALAALVWACAGQVDIIVSAGGKMVSESPTIEIRPLEKTVIKQIRVRVGDRVRKGQELITFDPVFNAAEEARLRSDLLRYEAQMERLNAELSNNLYAIDEKSDEQRWQYSLFVTRKRAFQERLNSFNEEIERILLNSQDKKEQLEHYYEMERKFLSIREHVSLLDIKEIQISRIQVESEIKTLAKEKLTVEAERNAFIEEWNTKTVEDIVQTKQDLIRTQKEYEKIIQLTSYVALYAPEDAIVHMIAPISIGSAVQEAEPLITLVPLHQGIEAEVEIPAEYIGKTQTGHLARLKLTAFPFQKYGTLNGHVRYISGDTFLKKRSSPIETGDIPYYLARITVDSSDNELKEKNIFIIPGMEVQAEIVVGQRRIIEYIIHPLIKSFDEAMREP